MAQTAYDFDAILQDTKEIWNAAKAGSLCPLDEVLFDYVYGDLTGKEYQTVSDHIRNCERCHIEVLKMEADMTEWEYEFKESADASFTKIFGINFDDISDNILKKLLNLQEWFRNLFHGEWQPAELVLASAYRGAADKPSEGTVKRAKAITLGKYKILVVVQLTPEGGEDVGVSLQIYPSGGVDFLPPDLRIVILDQAENVFMEDESESRNDRMELTWVREAGESYSIQFSLDGIHIKEGL